MKVLKGIFVYTMVILGALLGVGILLIGAMYLFKLPVFGYRFLNINIQKEFYNNINVVGYTIQTPSGTTLNFISDCIQENGTYRVKFIVDAGDYAVRLLPDDGQHNYISYYTMTDFTGLVKTDSKKYTTTVNTTTFIDDNKVLVVNMKVANPSGLVKFDDDSNELVIVVPENIDAVNYVYDFEIKTTGGNIILKNSVNTDMSFCAPLRVGSLSASTNKGNIVLGGFEYALDENGKKVANTSATLDDLVLYTKGGTIDFTNFKNLTINKKFVLESTKADYVFENLTAASGMEITGNNVLVKAKTITCGGDFVYKSETGGLEIDALNAGGYVKKVTTHATETTEEKYHYEKDPTKYNLRNVSIFSNSTNIVIGGLMGKARIENKYGKIDIKYLCNQASIKNENGNIAIGRSGILAKNDDSGDIFTDTSSIVAYNTYGDISVNAYYQNGLFNNVKGKIVLVAKGDGDYYTKAETKDGAIDFTTEGSAYNLVATDKANISINQKKVLEACKGAKENKTYYAKSTNGSISITLPTTDAGVGVGYIVNIDGKFGEKPTSSFSNLVENTYQYYFTGNTDLPNGKVVDTNNLDVALSTYPLIKLAGKSTYVYASL